MMNIHERFAALLAARTAIRSDDAAAALAPLRLLTDDYADDSYLWLYRAFLSDDPAEARWAYEQAIDIGTLWPDSHLLRMAVTAAQDGDFERALALIQRAHDFLARYLNGIRDHEAFASLQADPAFRDLVGLPPADGPTDLAGQRAYEIDYLIGEIKRLHLHGERLLRRPDVLAYLDALRAHTNEADDVAWFVRLQRLLVLLGDGHSTLYPWDDRGRLKVVPDTFYEFPEGLFITASDAATLVGANVLAIGDMPIDAVLTALTDYCSRDNTQTIKWVRPMLLVYAGFLQFIGATTDADCVTLHLQLRDGSTQTVDRPTRVRDGIPLMDKLNAPATAAAPLWLQRQQDPFWDTDLGFAHYIQFNQVHDTADQTLAAYAQSLRTALDAATNVIVDVRHNNGGDNTKLKAMIQQLVHFQVRAATNRLFVIIGRQTFSACQNFINRLDLYAEPIFVGEPSGSRPVFVGESTDLRLPYSGWGGSISCYQWVDGGMMDHRPWIAPHLPIELTAADYFNGIDPCLKALESLLAT